MHQHFSFTGALRALSMIMLFIMSCEKPEKDPEPETGTMTDVEGNVYMTIKIGNQWWMAENLKVKKYRNGVSIPMSSDPVEWSGRTNGACCIFDNGNNPLTPPGLLYNFHAIQDSNGLAPAGWHIPTDEEWKQLEMHLGMSRAQADAAAWRGTNEGDKLKVKGREGWSEFQDIWPTNESGFSALAGSCRVANGEFGNPGLFATGFWWTATANGNDEAWYRYLDYKNKNVFRAHCFNTYGFSIRCVKD